MTPAEHYAEANRRLLIRQRRCDVLSLVRHMGLPTFATASAITDAVTTAGLIVDAIYKQNPFHSDQETQ